MAEFRIDLKESIRIKKEFTAMIAEMKSLEKRLYAVKENLSSMSEYKDIVTHLNRQCQEVTEERKDVEKLLQTFSECVKCYEDAEKKVKEQEIDWHFVLDAAGLIPGIGAAFDGVNTAWYAAEGDWSNALLSGLAFAPGIGEAVGGGKTAVKAGGKVIGHIDDVTDIAKAADKAEDAAKAAGKAGKTGKNVGEIGKYVDEALESSKIISFTDYDKIYQSSIHNAEKDKVMLGKYDGGGPTSYITKAGDDYTYFSLGNEWNSIKAKYGYTDEDMFKLFNETFLDDGINAGKTFQFSHNPINDTGALGQEYQYLLKNNYKWDAGTMTMKPRY